MTSLSSNWKKLSSKLNDSSGKSKAPTKKKRKLDIKPKAKAVEVENVDPAPKVVLTSSIERMLWDNADEIINKNVGNTPPAVGRIQSKFEGRKKDIGKFLAMDCEFVGVGPEGSESALARVSVVNFFGHVVLDEYVKPREKVTDWRTWVSGVTPQHMKNALSFKDAQNKVASLLDNRVLVGHAVHHDLEALFLSHPKSKTRDTTQFKRFRSIAMGKTPSLKKLTLHFFQIDIQGAEHSSIEDARATMLLYRLYRKEFEQSIRVGDKSREKRKL